MPTNIESIEQLRNHLGLKDGQLLNTNLGAMDIFSVKNGLVAYGFLAQREIQTETIESFLSHFPEGFNAGDVKEG